ncbi:HPr(Ser) kinase/phosphatase [candidate division WOR-3 bacterium]|uniref:HPr kinase/phosphorylase n=1 Tax=candidate division WOR-3 bacterium TaxID=2052148 RepID=A0A660SGA9_UNCW3|nr:MAG: HPr(Ser) kinase/phosphatase [candidate division WOR-3 bacterium]
MKVKELYEEKSREFKLKIVAGKDGLKRNNITSVDIFRPGLVLAGFTEYYLSERIQIIGKTEVTYIKTLNRKGRNEAIDRLLAPKPPCFIISKSLRMPSYFYKKCEEKNIPVFSTSISTTPFIHLLTRYLEEKLAPTKIIQGTLLDIYGVGVLLLGKPGIGKSELALDLVHRGHRLVADDLVMLKNLRDEIFGSGCEKSDKLRHHIEIRGVGIIDILRIYGVSAVRLNKKVEVVVEMILWDEAKGDYERIGVEEKYYDILGVKLPYLKIPLVPGKNVSVIIEVIAKNYLLKLRGIYSAREYAEELKRVTMRRRRG